MSIVTVFKENDTLIFSSDSRAMELDNSAVASDTVTKIFTVAPDTFIATTGRVGASEFQVERAIKISADLNTTDIQVIARELGCASVPVLKILLERLRREHDEISRKAVSGAELIQGFTLVGRSQGKLGYVAVEYRAQPDGSIKYTTDPYFDAPRKISVRAGTPIELLTKIAVELCNDPATWTDPMDEVSRNFLETAKRVTPSIGGPWQIVKLGAGGTHWVSSPAWAKPEGGKSETSLRVLNGSHSVTIDSSGVAIVGGSLTSPKITCVVAGQTLTIDAAASAFPLTISNSTGVTDFGVCNIAMLTSAGVGAQLQAGSLVITEPSRAISIGVFGVSLITDTGGTLRTPFTGTLAAAIAAGKNVQGGIIY